MHPIHLQDSERRSQMIAELFHVLETYNRQLVGVSVSELDPHVCLHPDSIFDYDHDIVHSLGQKTVTGLSDEWSKVAALFDFVRDTIAYDFAPNVESIRDLSASEIAQKAAGFCHQKSILLVALLRAVDIPAALAFQTIVDHALLRSRFRVLQNDGTLHFHGLACAFLDGRWFRIDATLDAALCTARNYHVTTVVPGQETLLPTTTQDGKPHFTIIEDKGYFASYPVKLFRDLFLRHADIWALWRKFVKKEEISM